MSSLGPTFVNAPNSLISGPISLQTIITPAQLTANTDNWNPPGLATAAILRVSTDASRNLTGITAPVSDGTVLILQNVGSFNLVLINDATSTAANRFYFSGTASDTLTVYSNQEVVLVYDSSAQRWRVVAATLLSGAAPLSLGTATSGTARWAAREDHVHPLNGAWTLISDQTLGSDTTIDFTSIPGTYAHLVVLGQVRSVAVAVTTDLDMRVNNDSGGNYDYIRNRGLNATNSIASSLAQTAQDLGGIPGASATAAYFGSVFLVIPNYAGTTADKNWLSLVGAIDQTAASTNYELNFRYGHWRTTATPITRLTFSSAAFASSLKTASRLSLYGVAF